MLTFPFYIQFHFCYCYFFRMTKICVCVFKTIFPLPFPYFTCMFIYVFVSELEWTTIFYKFNTIFFGWCQNRNCWFRTEEVSFHPMSCEMSIYLIKISQYVYQNRSKLIMSSVFNVPSRLHEILACIESTEKPLWSICSHLVNILRFIFIT